MRQGPPDKTAKTPSSSLVGYRPHLLGSDGVTAGMTVKGRVGIPPQPGVRHVAFVDTSGGSGQDSLTIAIARADGTKAQLCRVTEWKAPYSPVDQAAEVAAIAREYGVPKVVGDPFSGGVWADLVRKQGTNALPCRKAQPNAKIK